jgi:conjugal transfer pilus assembly protein TraF
MANDARPIEQPSNAPAHNAAPGQGAGFVGFNAEPASSDFFTQGEEGWFWYKDAPIPEPEQKPAEQAPETPEVKKLETPRPQEATDSAPLGPAPMSTAWLRENMQNYLDRAIDNPTEENLRAYALMQRVMNDRSTLFTERMVEVVEGDPMLDESVRRPLSTAGAKAVDSRVSRSIRVAMRSLGESEQVGLWFFYSSDCDGCEIMASLLSVLEDVHGLKSLAISVDGKGPPPVREAADMHSRWIADNGQSEMLNLFDVPAVFLAHPMTETLTPVSYSVLSRDELEERIIRESYGLGLLSEEMYADTRFYDNSVPNLAEVDLEESREAIDWDDPSQVVNFLQNAAQRNGRGD